jgi:hypothetical protein
MMSKDYGTITINKNKDCDGNTYYTAYMYGVDGVVGGGDTRKEAQNALLYNLFVYMSYLEDEVIKTKNKLYSRLKEVDKLKKEGGNNG